MTTKRRNLAFLLKAILLLPCCDGEGRKSGAMSFSLVGAAGGGGAE